MQPKKPTFVRVSVFGNLGSSHLCLVSPPNGNVSGAQVPVVSSGHLGALYGEKTHEEACVPLRNFLDYVCIYDFLLFFLSVQKILFTPCFSAMINQLLFSSPQGISACKLTIFG